MFGGKILYNSLQEEFLVLNARGDFSLFCVFFVGMTFHTKTQIKHTLTARYCNRYSTTTSSKSTMSSPVVTKKEGMKMTKQTKRKIVVGSVVKSKVGESSSSPQF